MEERRVIMDNTETVSILIDRDIHSIIKKLSVDRRCTLRQLVNIALRDFINKQQIG